VPGMQWIDVIEWFGTESGWRFFSTAVLPFIAVFVAVLVSSAIARGSIKKLIGHSDRQLRAAVVGEFIGVARKAATWGSLSAAEQDRLDTLSREASTRLRLLPQSGASVAATWAEHQLTAIKRDAAGFSVQAEQSYLELRDALTQWHHRPRSIRRKFTEDLERFTYGDSSQSADLLQKQRKWAAQQHAEQPVVSTPPVVPETLIATIVDERVEHPDRVERPERP
jgi:hypothetical protein